MLRDPEHVELALVLGHQEAAHLLANTIGGWRDLTDAELATLGLCDCDRRKVRALQKLVAHGYPALAPNELATPDKVAAVYGERLGALVTEVMIAVALDGRNHVLAEIEVARGGQHAMTLTPSDVLRPLLRAGASGFVLVHNHPSANPEPSSDDVEMTEALAAAAVIVGIPLVDHVIVAARGGGFTSMLELGLLERKENDHERPNPRCGSRKTRRIAADRE